MKRITLKFTIFLILALTFVVCAGIFYAYAADSYQATVEDISGDKYFPAVKEALSKAEKSINMAMYFVSFDPQEKISAVSGLVEELVNAHKRGVKVKVILDQNIDFNTWEAGKGDWEKESKNSALFSYLKMQGIEVYFDSLYVLTHAKAIVIDEEVSIVGSANWSGSSLNKNWEVSCLVRSKDFAKELLEDFSKITIDPEAGIREEKKNLGIRLSNDFLRNPSLAAKMVTVNDAAALDLYLLFLKNFDGNPEARVDVNYKEWIQSLGMDKRLSYYQAQQILQEALRRLDERYHLIYRKKRPPQIEYIILLNYPDKTPYTLPVEKYSSIPDEYWRYGWDKMLLPSEKFCYFINLHKAGLSHSSIWSDYIIGLSKVFHLGRTTITRGVQELRRLNIVEIEYPAYVREKGKFKPRGPTYFRLLGLYSPEALEKEKDRIKQLYGRELFETAEKYAEIVFKANDTYIIEDIINKIKEYGLNEVDSAFKIVEGKAPDNPKRTYNYVIGVLRKINKEENN